MNLTEILTRCEAHFTEKPICHFKGQSVPYGAFADQVKRLTTSLIALGARKGERIVLLSSNRPEWLVSFFAIVATGATAVPVNPGLAAPEVCVIVNHCEPAIVIVEAELEALLDGATATPRRCILGAPGKSQWHELATRASPAAAFVEMDPADPALIFYTSGTTGTPKGVVLSHGAELFTAEMFSRHLCITPKDVSLITGSLAFIYHLVLHSLTALNHGATLVLLERFHPELACRAIERHRVSIMMAVPTAYVMMMNWMEGRRCDLSSMRFAITGGANFPAALAKRVRESLGFPVFDLWGLTECTPATAYDPSRDREGRPDSCGRPLPGFSLRIVDDNLRDLPPEEVGEILLTSPAIMDGYYKNPQATAETIVDGWVRSGDLGKLDADGFLYIVGRKKDMIIRGGANIYPVDIEEVLYKHPAVGECAVIGVPDNTFNELIKAFVLPKEGVHVTADDISAHCRRNLAEYKVPAIIEFVRTLPKGPTGKILRRKLRETPEV